MPFRRYERVIRNLCTELNHELTELADEMLHYLSSVDRRVQPYAEQTGVSLKHEAIKLLTFSLNNYVMSCQLQSNYS